MCAKYGIVLAAVFVTVSSVSSAQVLSKGSKANPSTQGYGTTGAILKDQQSSVRKDNAAAHQAAPGNSAAETAGAATPNDTSRTEKVKPEAH